VPMQLHAKTGTLDLVSAVVIHGTCPRHNDDFVIRGTFSCDNLGQVFPIDHAYVEFFRYRSDWFDDLVGATITDGTGSFEGHLSASIAGDYYARVHLDDKQGVHLNNSWESSFWSIDTAHRSNRNPLIDFGNFTIWKD